MIKKTMTYVDFNGETVVEDLYFNLNALEYTRLTARNGGDLDKRIAELVEKEDTEGIIALMEDLLLSSYGVKSEDGRRFVKTKQIREEFEYSQAYADLFVLLLTSPEETKKFGQGIASSAQAQQAVPTLTEV